jgi:AraC-like DNA-binding protein
MRAHVAGIKLSFEMLHLAAQADYQASRFAKLLGVNPNTLQRYFQKTLGCSTQKFLDHLRQIQAKQLALNGGKEFVNIGLPRRSIQMRRS